MDVLVKVRKPLLHQKIDFGELDVVCKLKMSVFILAQDDVGNPLVSLMWWTLSEKLHDEPLDVDVRIHDAGWRRGCTYPRCPLMLVRGSSCPF